MYSNNERTQVRERLVSRALADSRFSGVAVCGSAAVGREDTWSDIDLAFGVAPAAGFSTTVADWTADMYDVFGSLHHVEIATGSAVYRAFLLPGTLQVDLNFVPADDFRAHGPKFRLLSGSAREQLPPVTALAPDHYAGMGWLYAMQARSCIGRGKLWQAERMVVGIREQALALTCLRHGLPALHGAGVDQLPQSLLTAYVDCLVGAIDAAELDRAFRAVVTRLLEEVDAVDPELHKRLAGTLMSLAGISR
jgi:predicted nucleotidyltransferase